MNGIAEIVEWLKKHPESTVDDYFQTITWSIEKDEYIKMTDEEKELFEIMIRRI